jgi:hypothetical protein
MKKVLVALTLILTLSLVGCGGTTAPTVANDGRVDVLSSSGRVDVSDHSYTVVKDNETGCTVMIVENNWHGTMGVTTLKCE